MPSMDTFILWLAGFSTLLYCGKLLLAFAGGDDAGDDAGDIVEVGDGADVDSGVDPGFTLFTTQSLLAFGMGFGWLCLALMADGRLSRPAAVALAALNGTLMLLLNVGAMVLLRRLNTTARPTRPQVGDRARTYTALGPHRQPPGLVQAFSGPSQQAQQYVGMTDAAEAIPAHVDVVVRQVLNGTLLVARDEVATLAARGE